MTELLPPSNPVLRAYTYTVYHSTSNPCLTTVLAVCQYVAKETLKEHYKRLQSDPSASDEYSFVYESASEVVLQNNKMLVLDVEANELKENEAVDESCVTL
jgi:hypothetical protein